MNSPVPDAFSTNPVERDGEAIEVPIWILFGCKPDNIHSPVTKSKIARSPR
jgi:hypothetical protein